MANETNLPATGIGGPASPEPPIYDLALALERMDGDSDLLNEVIDIFLSDIEECLGKVRAEAAKGDVTALQRAVHTVKGAVSNFSSPVATDVAQRMESHCRQGSLDSAIQLMGQLETSVRNLTHALQCHRGGKREAA